MCEEKESNMLKKETNKGKQAHKSSNQRKTAQVSKVKPLNTKMCKHKLSIVISMFHKAHLKYPFKTYQIRTPFNGDSRIAGDCNCFLHN